MLRLSINPVVMMCLAVVFAVIFLVLKFYFNPRRSRHRKNINQAKKLIAMFQGWGGDNLEARVMAYLRKIDPLVFEELILTAIAHTGAKIIRNKRYTGDGGVDGVFFKDGVRWLMQAKRYSSAINPNHITDFVRVCGGGRGLFVHTGRTGPKSRRLTPPNIHIVSGEKLVSLILSEKI